MLPPVRDTEAPGRVAIVDYGLGNLFSVENACRSVGLEAELASTPHALERAAAVILPGVGSFEHAMAELKARDLVSAIKQVVSEGRPLIGICLGAQLLLSESHEFGRHKGLSVVPGVVLKLTSSRQNERVLKVPQVGWNQIYPGRQSWDGSLLDGLAGGTAMYFVHSYYLVPADDDVVLAVTRYGDAEFCSGFRLGALYGFQFHPERSALDGLHIYRQIAALLKKGDSPA